MEGLETRDSYTIFFTTGKRATGTIEIAGNQPAGSGFAITGGTNTAQPTFSSDVAYRTENWGIQLDGSSVVNRQNGTRSSGRNTLDLFYLRYLNNRWFVSVTSDLLNSQQQDLTLRRLPAAVSAGIWFG